MYILTFGSGLAATVAPALGNYPFPRYAGHGTTV
jgi:hypothetical protein